MAKRTFDNQKRLTSPGDYMGLPYALIKALGGDAAIMLVHLVRLDDCFTDNGKTEDGFFYHSSEKIKAETGFKRAKRDRIMADLEGYGFIETRDGHNRVKDFKVNMDAICNLIKTGEFPTKKDCRKPTKGMSETSRRIVENQQTVCRKPTKGMSKTDKPYVENRQTLIKETIYSDTNSETSINKPDTDRTLKGRASEGAADSDISIKEANEVETKSNHTGTVSDEPEIEFDDAEGQEVNHTSTVSDEPEIEVSETNTQHAAAKLPPMCFKNQLARPKPIRSVPCSRCLAAWPRSTATRSTRNPTATTSWPRKSPASQRPRPCTSPSAF